MTSKTFLHAIYDLLMFIAVIIIFSQVFGSSSIFTYGVFFLMFGWMILYGLGTYKTFSNTHQKNNQIMEPKHTVSIDVPEGYKLIDKGNNHYEVVKKEQTLPKTWEEFCETHRVKDTECLILEDSKVGSWNSFPRPTIRHEVLDKNLLPDKETAEAFLALMQLIQLMKCYNGGWEPDWTDCGTCKHILVNDRGGVSIIMNREVSHILAFKSKELAAEFLENFKDLIKISKPLI